MEHRSGYGAVAFDGTARLNQDLIAALSLPDTLVQEDIAQTREIAQTRKKVAHRIK